MSNGKGSAQRPKQISDEELLKNWQRIFNGGSGKKKDSKVTK